MALTLLVQQLINAVSLGSIYALVAIGLAMVFSILHMINFAHGEMMMIGAFTYLFLVTSGANPILSLVVAGAAGALGGLLMERLAYRPVRGSADVTLLLTSFAVSMLLQNLGILFWTSRSRPFPVPEALAGTIELGGFGISRVYLLCVLVSLLLLAALSWFIGRTSMGVAMRAAAEDLMAARLAGVAIDRVVATAFVIGSALAAVAGLLWGVRAGKIDPLMGFEPLLKAFVATVVGGFGSLSGAVLGSFLVAFVEVFAQGYLPTGFTGYRDGVLFLVLILFLVFRPQGILGSEEAERA